MAIRGVIFDYGMVLSKPQDPAAHTRLLELTGLDRAAFEEHYWRHRHAYDRGDLNGPTFWQSFATDARITLTPGQIAEIIEQDILMWSSLNEEMLGWVRALQDRGMRTAILSNMGEEMLQYMREEFAWLQHFTHHTWSCELRIAKPDPAIYTWTCEKLGVKPEEAIFIDDKPENVASANELGIHAIQFRSVAQLRHDLESRNLLPNWPLPGDAPAPSDGQERVTVEELP